MEVASLMTVASMSIRKHQNVSAVSTVTVNSVLTATRRSRVFTRVGDRGPAINGRDGADHHRVTQHG